MYLFIELFFYAGLHSQTYNGGARICCEEGKSWKVGLRALTVNFRAGCISRSLTTGNSFVTDAVLIERAVTC